MARGEERPFPLFGLAAAAALRAPRGVSVRRWLAIVSDGLAPDATLEALAERQREWSRIQPADELSALRRLAGDDLRDLLAHVPQVQERVAAWADPHDALRLALHEGCEALAKAGVDVSEPALHLADGLPPPYDHPSLAVVSLDSRDAAHSGLPVGIHVDRRRLWPFVTEAALCHVLVHVALGARSPELLGRGLEEGACEVLGALHAAASVIGADAAEGAFTCTRLTPASSPHREAFLGWTRGAALLAMHHGLPGLAALVSEGREALKRAEASLSAGRPEDVRLPRLALEPAMRARLDRVLLARGRPLVVSPLAFWFALHARTQSSAEDTARALGLPLDAARRAARELMDRVFVAVVADDGALLVDDLDLVLSSGALRYEAPACAPPR